MQYLLLFVSGVIFGKYLLGMFDYLLEWFNTWVSKRAAINQIDMQLMAHQAEEMCGQKQPAIGFNVDEAVIANELEEDEDDEEEPDDDENEDKAKKNDMKMKGHIGFRM